VFEKIKVGRQVFNNLRFIGFSTFGDDGFSIIIESEGRKYAITLGGKVYNIVERGTQLFAEIPYAGGRVYRAPLRFKL